VTSDREPCPRCPCIGTRGLRTGVTTGAQHLPDQAQPAEPGQSDRERRHRHGLLSAALAASRCRPVDGIPVF